MVSVVVPVYNIEKYLPECLESLIDQTYKELEIILVDDGSTDLSGEICEEYVAKDTRICVVHQKNGGLVAARMTGITHSTGEYIIFVDGDDYVGNSYIGDLVNAIDFTGADMCHSVSIIETNRESQYRIGNWIDDRVVNIDNPIDIFKKYLFAETDTCLLPAIWAKIFKTELIKKVYSKIPYDQAIGEDLLCFCYAICEMSKFAIVNTDKYYYRIRQDSLTHTDSFFIGSIGLCYRLKELLCEYGYYYELREAYVAYTKKALAAGINSLHDSSYHLPRFTLNDIELYKDKRVVLYGAGAMGRDVYEQLSIQRGCEIIAWCDRNYESINYDFCDVINPELLQHMEYDIVLLCTMHVDLAISMRCYLESLNIQKEKIRWVKENDVVPKEG